jgi:NitT/TauT family transport system substrate-binding protein
MVPAFIERGLAFAAVAFACSASSGGGQALPVIHVAACVCDDVKSVYYGIRSGIFARNGLSVDVIPVANGAAALASLVGGSTQVALTSDLPIFQGHVRGIGFTIVVPAEWYISDAATAGTLLVKKDSPIQSGRDLTGKTVAVQSLRDLNYAGLMTWIDATGGDSRSVKAVELPLPAVVAAIDDGRVDAGSVQTPFLQEGLASGKVRVLAKTYDAIAKQFEAAVFVSMADYVGANRDAMMRFVRGMHEAVVYTNAHPAELTDLVASFTKMDRALVAKTLRTTDPEYLDPKWLQPVIDTAFRYKLIDREFRAEELFSGVLLRAPS